MRLVQHFVSHVQPAAMPIRDDDSSDTFSELVPQVFRSTGDRSEVNIRLVRAEHGVPCCIGMQVQMATCTNFCKMLLCML